MLCLMVTALQYAIDVALGMRLRLRLRTPPPSTTSSLLCLVVQALQFAMQMQLSACSCWHTVNQPVCTQHTTRALRTPLDMLSLVLHGDSDVASAPSPQTHQTHHHTHNKLTPGRCARRLTCRPWCCTATRTWPLACRCSMGWRLLLTRPAAAALRSKCSKTAATGCSRCAAAGVYCKPACLLLAAYVLSPKHPLLPC